MTTDELKDYLESSSHYKIKALNVKDGKIDYITFDTMTLTNLADDDYRELYDFYYEGLSERSRNYFPPYPLFNPYPESPQQLRERIIAWRAETDWFFFVLKEARQIIGVSLLKKISTGEPVTGMAVIDRYHKRGLGTIMLKTAITQAQLLNINTVYSGVAPDNDASFALHTKCGFVPTGKMVPHYVIRDGHKIIDRHDREVILLIS